MKPVQIAENIYWVGGIDWNLRNFHGYLTQRGSSYNAYLIIDEKVTLIDTVKYYLTDEMIKRISHIVDPSKIDYIISNHVEMDHSGGLPHIMKYCPNATIYTSPKGETGLKAHYGDNNWKYQVVNNGDRISLGKKNINFVLTPMVHWPDNMVSYLAEDKILFSNDAFGQHIASSQRLDSEYPIDIIMEEARKYYANIVLPYGNQVTKAVEALKDLEIDLIAPSHGIMWKEHIPRILNEYKKWMTNTTEEKALIIFDTMWHSTEKIAHAIRDAFEELDINHIFYSLQDTHMSDIMTEVITAKYICVGSPTLNNNMLPTVASFLTYFKGLAPKNRVGLAFGSYGWGGQSIGQVSEILNSCKFEMLNDIKINYRPSTEQLKTIKQSVMEQIKQE